VRNVSPSAALSAAVLTMVCQVSSAAELPSPTEAAAQELQRQQERERAQRERLQPSPDVRLPRSVAPQVGAVEVEGESPCFPIRRVELDGDDAWRFAFALRALPERQGWLEQPACLGAKGINAVLQRLQNAIVRRGYVTTRVLAQPQDLKQGTLRLTVIPGRVRNIVMNDAGSHRGHDWNALPTESGRILDLRDIEQGLENFKRVPTVDADIQIAPGEQPGESDLLVAWRQGNPIRVNLSADDAGSKATGKYQGSFTLSYDNWWTLNDLFYVTLNHDLDTGEAHKGTSGHVVHYSVPLCYWLFGATASHNTYRQSVAGLSQTYVYSGNSSDAELRVSRVVYRDAVRKSTLSFSGWNRSSRNFIDDTEVEVQRRRMAGWELGATHHEVVEQATLDLDATYRRGTHADGALPAPEEAFGEGTSRPRILKAGAQLNLPFSNEGQRMRYSLAWRAQWNRTPLVPQDRFSIGSRYTVRGFDGESTLSADRGWLVRNDLSWALGATGAELYAGADYGQLGGTVAAQLVGRHLEGCVFGLRGSRGHLSYDAFIGARLNYPTGFQVAHETAGFNLSWSY